MRTKSPTIAKPRFRKFSWLVSSLQASGQSQQWQKDRTQKNDLRTYLSAFDLSADCVLREIQTISRWVLLNRS
ncbi:MAG: hypothetical protein NTY15_19940 [Planctomycetota bacterium]|nr:hypothetical protein [Planctomycetota bacterium]